jgi:tripartite-type tricarboxylate transporter receptor subunit TctC
MKIHQFALRGVATIAVAALAGSAPVPAQHRGAADASDYPSRPIRLITPAAPGGTTDILSRLVGARLTDVFKQQVVVDNRASASGVIAADITAHAPPDGYTLFMAYHQHTVNAALNPKLPYHPVNDFTPITQLTRAGLMLVVHPSTPVKNLKEFIDWTKNFKGALNFGSAGNGSGGHLAGELYKLMTGVKAQHIPYKGSGPALIDLAAGQYHFNFAGMQASQAFVKSGKLRALAVTAPKRVAALPDLPAVAEVLPGFEVVGWYGIVAPAKLPRPILTRLHDEIVKIIHQPEVRERIVADGSEPVGSTPEEFRQYMLADLTKWAKLVKESGAKLD